MLNVSYTCESGASGDESDRLPAPDLEASAAGRASNTAFTCIVFKVKSGSFVLFQLDLFSSIINAVRPALSHCCVKIC